MGMESENTTERFVAAVNSRTAEENARILGVPVETLRAAMGPASGKTMNDFLGEPAKLPGIEVNVAQACADYALRLGRLIESLTDDERRHAFQQAVLTKLDGRDGIAPLHLATDIGPALREARRREFFRDLNDGARDWWRSVSLDHWVLLDGDNVMAWVSRAYQGADGEWGWRVARCNGGTDVMVQPCEGTSGGPATLAGAKSAAEAAMSLGSACDLGLSRAWGQQWEAERERAREKTVAVEVEFVADPADGVRLCMNAVAAAQDALAAARAAVEHAVKLGAGETLRAIVGEAVERIGSAVPAAPRPRTSDQADALTWALASTSPAKLLAMRDALGMAIDGDARTERDEARAGWAEQTADSARLRIALQESQRQLVQAYEDIDVMRAEAGTRGDALRLLGWVTDGDPKAWAESVREHVATHVWTAGSSEASPCTRCGVSQHGAREAPTCADGFRLARDRAYALATSKQAEFDAATDRLTALEAERLRWTKCGEDPETAAADMRAMYFDQQAAHGLRAVLRIGHRPHTEIEEARELRRLADATLVRQARPEVQAEIVNMRKAARDCLRECGWEPSRLSLIGL